MVQFMIAGMKLRGIVMYSCFVALAAGLAEAQPILLWEKGTLDDVKGLRRVYVVAPRPAERSAIERQLNGRHGLRVVRDGSKQFQVNYSCSRPGNAKPEEPSTADVRVYVMRGVQNIVAWSRSESISTCKDAAARTTLVKEFLKEFAQMNRKRSIS